MAHWIVTSRHQIYFGWHRDSSCIFIGTTLLSKTCFHTTYIKLEESHSAQENVHWFLVERSMELPSEKLPCYVAFFRIRESFPSPQCKFFPPLGSSILIRWNDKMNNVNRYMESGQRFQRNVLLFQAFHRSPLSMHHPSIDLRIQLINAFSIFHYCSR